MARRSLARILLVSAILLAIALGRSATAEEPGVGGALSRALEASDLSPEGKELLRQKALGAVRGGVPEVDVADLIQRGGGRRIPAADLGRLFDLVTEAKRQDLPVGPVLDKIKEGLAKRVPPERILSVASRLSGALAASRDLIRRAEREGVRVEAPAERARAIEAVADALGRGVRPNELEELSRQMTRSSRERATMSRLGAGAEVTADLAAMGLSPHDAAETVGAALAQGLGGREVERLRERLARELGRGAAPAEGARRLRDEIRSERPEDRRDGGPEQGSGRDRDSRGREGMGGGRPGRP